MCKPCYYTIQFPVPRGGKMVRFRRKAMGNRDTCVPGGGTPPLREDGRLGGFAGERGKFGRFCCDNPSVKIGYEEPILTAPFTQGSLRALPRQCDGTVE